MSYCRMIEGDVYVYLAASNPPALVCHWCDLNGPDDPAYFEATTTAAMIAHLDEHRTAGHHIPDSCYERLREDQEENDRRMGAA